MTDNTESAVTHYVGDGCKPDGHRLLNMATKQTLATVALSHPEGCDCEAACKPLRIDRQHRDARYRELENAMREIAELPTLAANWATDAALIEALAARVLDVRRMARAALSRTADDATT